MRTLPGADPSRGEIPELRGRLVPWTARPNRFCVPPGKAVTTAERRALCASPSVLSWSGRPARIGRRSMSWSRASCSASRSAGPRGGQRRDPGQRVTSGAGQGAPVRDPRCGERFRSGETLIEWNRAFRPSPAQFAEEARRGQFLHNLKLGRSGKSRRRGDRPRSRRAKAKDAEAAATWRDMRATATLSVSGARPARRRSSKPGAAPPGARRPRAGIRQTPPTMTASWPPQRDRRRGRCGGQGVSARSPRRRRHPRLVGQRLPGGPAPPLEDGHSGTRRRSPLRWAATGVFGSVSRGRCTSSTSGLRGPR